MALRIQSIKQTLGRGLPLAILGWLVSSLVLAVQLNSLFQAMTYQQSQATVASSNTAGHRLRPDWWHTADTPHALFAQAVREGAAGNPLQALKTYARLLAQLPVSDPLHAQAQYNSGNLYMRQAVHLLETQGLPAWDEAGPLVALAKECYQNALRARPDWSEAKYNYQLALRLSPTTYGMHGPQQYEDEQLKQEETPSGWPAMPGNPRGMP